jgi:hypothetical protein
MGGSGDHCSAHLHDACRSMQLPSLAQQASKRQDRPCTNRNTLLPARRQSFSALWLQAVHLFFFVRAVDRAPRTVGIGCSRFRFVSACDTKGKSGSAHPPAVNVVACCWQDQVIAPGQ